LRPTLHHLLIWSVAFVPTAWAQSVTTFYFGAMGSNDDYVNAMAVDANGNMYVTGSTTGSSFATSGAAQPMLARGMCTYGYPSGQRQDQCADAFVAKIGASGNLVYATYLGGKAADRGMAIAVDSDGNAYVAGYTESTDFPVTQNVFQRSSPGHGDIFIAKLDPTGAKLLYSTYLGGSGRDSVSGLALDRGGNVYLTGSTSSEDFPVTPGVLGASPAPCFVSKLDALGAGLLYSTYFPVAQCNAIAIDDSGNVYLTGTAGNNLPLTPGAFQTIYRGGGTGPDSTNSADAFVSKLNAGATALLFSTFLGGTGYDSGSRIVVDARGSTYVLGWTYSRDFPTTPGSWINARPEAPVWSDAVPRSIIPRMFRRTSQTFQGWRLTQWETLYSR
jgi:hypothetical protein